MKLGAMLLRRTSKASRIFHRVERKTSAVQHRTMGFATDQVLGFEFGLGERFDLTPNRFCVNLASVTMPFTRFGLCASSRAPSGVASASIPRPDDPGYQPHCIAGSG